MREIQMMHVQRMFIGFHGLANVIHYRLVPFMGFIPPSIAAVEELTSAFGGPGEIPADIVICGIDMIRLELDIPSLIRKRKHVFEWISCSGQIDVSIEKHKVVTVRNKVHTDRKLR